MSALASVQLLLQGLFPARSKSLVRAEPDPSALSIECRLADWTRFAGSQHSPAGCLAARRYTGSAVLDAIRCLAVSGVPRKLPRFPSSLHTRISISILQHLGRFIIKPSACSLWTSRVDAWHSYFLVLIIADVGSAPLLAVTIGGLNLDLRSVPLS